MFGIADLNNVVFTGKKNVKIVVITVKSLVIYGSAVCLVNTYLFTVGVCYGKGKNFISVGIGRCDRRSGNNRTAFDNYIVACYTSDAG